MTRKRFIKVRVSEIELEEIRAKAAEAYLSISDLFRQLVLNTRLRKTRVGKELFRQIARIGSNINQLARWENTRKERAITLETLLWLNRIYSSIRNLSLHSSEITSSSSDSQADMEKTKDVN